ncbi:MAG: aminoglycoside phosphotransferase family protein [Actinobacteria bacterium]|nr:aminoglycoside phosphotransferase family protein [Actinomycetota bacterium]MBO0835208.1 aminoglycoside phosphotransferase family protein [Actinomycetota bacterium]
MTHQVSVDHEREVVVKHFSDGTRGEAEREWRALRLLATHAPRLAPEPIRADLDTSPAEVVMSLLPGEPLGGRPLTATQEWALALALGQLWQAVPVGLVRRLPGEVNVHARFERLVRDWAAVAADKVIAELVVREALAIGTAWLARVTGLGDDNSDVPAACAVPRVLGQGDAHLANFLWDGELIRIVDFEDSGVSDRAFELAVLVEHISAWRDSGLDADRFTDSFDFTSVELARLADWRRLAALYWLLRLRDRGDATALRHQAERLLSLL